MNRYELHLSTKPQTQPLGLGSRVRIRESSRYANRASASNPMNCLGAVIAIMDFRHNPVRVHWDNGTYNVYRVDDLEVVNEQI